MLSIARQNDVLEQDTATNWWATLNFESVWRSVLAVSLGCVLSLPELSDAEVLLEEDVEEEVVDETFEVVVVEAG